MARDPGWTSGERRDAARARLAGNPFYVLGLRPDCARAEIEREGQKLIAMLELELAGAKRYRSPIGSHLRTPELVREAMAELRDPNRRLLHELWATLDPLETGDRDRLGDLDDPSSEGPEQPELAPFAALRALGFGDWNRRGS